MCKQIDNKIRSTSWYVVSWLDFLRDVPCYVKFWKDDHSTRIITARNTRVTARNQHAYHTVSYHNHTVPWQSRLWCAIFSSLPARTMCEAFSSVTKLKSVKRYFINVKWIWCNRHDLNGAISACNACHLSTALISVLTVNHIEVEKAMWVNRKIEKKKR